MMDVGIRSEELSGKFPPDLHPICRDLSSSWFSVWNGFFVVVDWSRHSSEKSGRINFRCDETGVLCCALGEYAVNELALTEFGGSEITSNELRTLERNMTKESSAEHTAFEGAVLEC